MSVDMEVKVSVDISGCADRASLKKETLWSAST